MLGCSSDFIVLLNAVTRLAIEQAEQAEQRKNAMITKFESLPHDEQEQILNEVGDKVGGVFSDFYKRARANGTAHKDVMFMSWFFEIMQM